MTTTTLQEIAREAADQFETATRDDDRTYVRLRRGSPDWIGEMVRAAHGDMLPDDWRYACIAAACEHVADDGDPDDPHDFADAQVDVYTGARLAWLASHLNRASYCNDAADQYGYASDAERGDGGIIGLIGLGQYVEASEVYGLVVEALREQEEERA